MLPHDGADLADHAGTVFVVQKQHMFVRREVHGVIAQADDSRLSFEKSAGNQAPFSLPFEDESDDVGEGVGLGGLGLLDDNPHLFGNLGGINHVDVLIELAVKERRKAAYGKRRAVVMGDCSAESESDL